MTSNMGRRIGGVWRHATALWRRGEARRRRAARAAALSAALGCAAAAASAEELAFFSLGAGELDGGYWRTAQAVCDLVNADHRGALRCSPETTPGSRYNLDALMARELDFAILQADVAARAEGEGASGLRLVSGLYDETLTLLAAPSSGVTRNADLAGKVVDIGAPASGRNATVRAIMAGLGVDETFFSGLRELPGPATVEALCARRVDAALLVVGHPSALVEAALACGATIATFRGPQIDAFVAETPSMRPALIAASRYGGLREDVDTIALRAVLVTRVDTPPDLVEAVAATMLARLGALERATPLLAGLTAGEMAEPGVGPPLHPGAARAFGAD